MLTNGNYLLSSDPLQVSLIGDSFCINSGLVQVDGISVIFNDNTKVKIEADSCLLGIELSLKIDVSIKPVEVTPFSSSVYYEDLATPEQDPDSDYFISTTKGIVEEIEIPKLTPEDIELYPKCKPLTKGVNQIIEKTRFKALAYCQKIGEKYNIFPCHVNPLLFNLVSDSNYSSNKVVNSFEKKPDTSENIFSYSSNLLSIL